MLFEFDCLLAIENTILIFFSPDQNKNNNQFAIEFDTDEGHNQHKYKW